MKKDVVRTLIIAELVLALLVVVPVVGVQATQRSRSRRTHIPRIQSFTSSKEEIDVCPFVPSSSICSSSGTIVTLTVKASDPDSDKLTYKYSVSGGAIVGSGATVNWDLTQSRLGIQTANVEVANQWGGKAWRRITISLVPCGACDPGCPTLTVTCPTNVNEGEIAVFDASVGGEDLSQNLIYLWNHSNGKRIAGDPGPKLQIKATGVPGDVISATVRVLGLDPACNYQASCESKIVKQIH